MNRRGYLTVLGGTLLAGCIGDESDTQDAGQETVSKTPTQTPTPPPTSTATLDDVELPDGVTDTEVTTDLLTAHQRVVLGEPYTIEWERVRGDGLRKTTVHIGTDSVHQEQVSSGMSSKSFYKDSSGGFARANGGEYYFATQEPIDREDLGQFFAIREHLAAGDYAPTGVVQGDERLLIKADATDASVTEGLQGYVDSIESYGGSLLIAPSGQIVEWVYDWEYTGHGRTNSEEFTYRTLKIGSTSVSEPGWLATAREEAFSFTPRRPEEDGSNYVAVDIEGDGSLPSNIYAQLSNQGQTAGRPVDISVTGGDTLYIALTQDGLRVSKQPDFSQAKSLSGTVRLHLSFNGVYVLESATITM